ncbi:hypothetical protein NKR19_g2020 [Coniochaeta hoffmannii]|uniref:Uncharacterized protein n=1 Tax=Coniochaeta hoffmannii TaxID=91930 RepID=A0AA38VZK4_9PEZI|nr:hypothetical protein NKR19_g2020 [Coniochaeta hoffmannii]
MHHVWKTGSFWYFRAIRVRNGMFSVFNSDIQPLFNEEHCSESIFDHVLFWYWGFGAQRFIENKVKDKEKYLERIKEAYGEAANTVN